MKRLEAMEHFQRKINENPMDTNAHHHLAVLAKAGGDQETYARHSRIAWLTQQGGPEVSNELALAKLQGGQREGSRDAAASDNCTMADVPTSVLQFGDAAGQTGPVYEQLGRSTEALMHFQRALSLAPDDAEVARRIALLSLGRGRTDVATQHYSRHRDLTGQHYDLKL